MSIGIYKITSPSGKIYIGQSTDIEKRFKGYLKKYCKKQTKLYNSFLKHGVQNHKFEILQTCEEKELNFLEEKYVRELKCCENGLNIRGGGGSYGKLSEETKIKLRNHRHSEETISIIKLARAKQNPPSLGKILSEEHKIKIGKSNKGKKMSPENIYKMVENGKKRIGEKNSFFGKKHSQETIEKIRLKKINNKHSEETKLKMRNSHKGKSKDYLKGRKLSIESIMKREETKRLIKQERLIMIF